MATTDGAIVMKRVQIKGSPKIDAIDFAGQVGLKVGDRLGVGLAYVNGQGV